MARRVIGTLGGVCLLIFFGYSPKAIGQVNPSDSRGLLLRKVSLSAAEMPLNSAIEEIARSVEAKVDWDLDALREVKFDIQQPVTLNIEQEGFFKAVNKILRWNRAAGCFSVTMSNLDGSPILITTFAAHRARTRNVFPKWLHADFDNGKLSARVDENGQIVGLEVTDILSGHLIAWIGSLEHLRRLTIQNVHGTPTSVAPLAKLIRLEHLALRFDSHREDGLADAILKRISALNAMQSVHLDKTGVTDVGIKQLESFTGLTSLTLHREGRLTDAALTSIAKLKRLRMLHLSGYLYTNAGQMQFSRAALRCLTELRDLVSLHIAVSEVTPELLAFPKLKRLEFSGPMLDEQLATRIAACRELEQLDLHYQKVADHAFKPLAGHPTLERLNLRARDITDSNVTHLNRCPRLSDIRLETRGLTDKPLNHLSELTSLTNLSVNWSRNRFTQDGVHRLAKLPKLESLELRIIPPAGGIGIPNYSNVPVRRRQFDKPIEGVRQETPELPGSDVDSFAEIFPNTIIELTYDDFDLPDK